MSHGTLPTSFKGVIYGTEGVGKTSLAAAAPSPIFFDLEDGSARLNVTRYSFQDGRGSHIPRTYQAVLDAIADLTENESPYKTLVIDSLSALEPLIWDHLLRRDSAGGGRKLESIESYGYGKGYQMAVEEGKAFLAAIDRMRERRGINALLICHAQIKNFHNPSGSDYDRYSLRMHEKLAGKISGWADFLGFAIFEESAFKDGKGVSTGRRLVHFSHCASWDAKTRYALPVSVEIMETNRWAEIGAAIDYSNAAPLTAIIADIDAELARIADETLVKTVHASIEKVDMDNEVNARNTLIAFLNRLRQK